MASVRKLPSGKWQARASYKDAAGKYREKSFTADTRRDALRIADLYEPRPGAGKVGEMIETYIEAKEAVLSPSTIRAYISMANTIKTRHAAFWSLATVSQRDAQRLANQFSPKTARNVIGLVSSAVKFCGGTFPPVTFPRWELDNAFVPDEKDLGKILSEVKGTKMELPVLLGMMGLRRSEVCAVTPDDLEGNVLHIHEAVVIAPDGSFVRKGTKTAGSDRYITLPDQVADLLREGPVTLSLNSIGKRFSQITKKLGITMRFHDLRAYFASYCHNVLHLSNAQVMRLGGWSTDKALVRHYRHSMHDEETAALVATAFSEQISARISARK